jgi:hypothetical protein
MKRPASYGTQMFIIVLRISRYWCLSEPDEYILTSCSFKIYFYTSVPSTLGSLKRSLPFRFSTKMLCEFCISLMIATFPANRIFLDLITVIVLDQYYTLLSLSCLKLWHKSSRISELTSKSVIIVRFINSASFCLSHILCLLSLHNKDISGIN